MNLVNEQVVRRSEATEDVEALKERQRLKDNHQIRSIRSGASIRVWNIKCPED